MLIHCTRPGCQHPQNSCPDLDEPAALRGVTQKFCTSCGMVLILDGRYLPQKLLGRGGFGAAFLALDRRMPNLSTCVVKQFQPAVSLGPEQLAKAKDLFEREGEVLAQLGKQNRHIPELLAFFPLTVPSSRPGVTEEYFYLVQEFIDGLTLEQELAAQGKFSEAQVLEVLESVLEILQFVHSQGTIHRDVKPSNIMRRQDGHFFLLDFGAVKKITQGTSSGRSTEIYSPGFAPPEQMLGAAVSPTTDLYALAATCVMLLTGQQPEQLYDGNRNCWNWRPYAPQVSQRLAKLLDLMLSQSPRNRPSSAEVILKLLRESPASTRPGPNQPLPPTLPAPPAGPAAKPVPAVPPTQVLPGGKPPAVASPVPPTQALGTPTPARPAPVRQPPRHLPALRLLNSALFTGFEGGVLLILLVSLLGPTLGAVGAWLLLLVVLIGVQARQLIERFDLVVVAVVSTTVVAFIPQVRAAFALHGLVDASMVIATGGVILALGSLVTMALFLLIYRLLSRRL